MTTKFRTQNENRHGFTLVEVLVSSFLTLVIMGMLFGVLMGTISAWEGGTSNLKSSGDARFALDFLKTDLESMVARQTSFNQMWLASGPVPVDDDDAPGIENTWLVFLTPSLDRDAGQEGDIVAVSYQSVFQDPISTVGDHRIFGLYKGMTSTEVAFNQVLGNDDVIGAGKFWYQNPLVTNRSGFIAPNVVGFDVTWWIRHSPSGTERLERFDSSHYLTLNNVLQVWEGNTQVVSGGKIESAEVSMTTITDEGMRRYNFLRENPSRSISEILDEIIEEFGTTHTMRIPIHY